MRQIIIFDDKCWAANSVLSDQGVVLVKHDIVHFYCVWRERAQGFCRYLKDDGC